MNKLQKSSSLENSESSRLRPELKIADKFLDLKTLDANIILDHLDEQIKMREIPIEQRKKLLK